MTKGEISLVLNKLVFLLNSSFPTQSNGEPLLSQWDQCDKFAASIVSVLDACIRHIEAVSQPILIAEVVCRCSWYYCEKGWFGHAARLADDAIALCERVGSNMDHAGYSAWYVRDMISHHFNTKGVIGAKIPLPDFGLSMYEKVLQIRTNNRREGNAEDEMWIGAAIGNSAISLMAIGRAEEALPKLYELTQREDMRPNKDVYLSKFCLCLYLLGRHNEALVQSEIASACIRSHWGEDDVRMAT